MKIKLNEKAEKYFNEKVQDFLYELKPDKTKKRTAKKVESSAAHTFITKNISKNDIIEITLAGYVDQLTGRQVARYFITDNGPVGLNQKSYAEFDKFINGLYQKKEINSLLSQSFLYDCTFKWFEKSYKGELGGDIDLITFLKEEGEKSIKKFKVSLPISFLSIEKPLKIGNVLLDYLKKELCNKYVNNSKRIMKEQGQFNENNFKIFETRFRKRYQGTVFASVTIEAEQQKCLEIAKIQTEKALTVLRFFSPSVFIPELPSYFCIMGQTDLPKNYSFVYENGSEMPLVSEGIDERRMYSWAISADEYLIAYKDGLRQAADLIFNKDPSQFEESVLNSMYLFGQALTSREFQDKIVYALVSIETLLLQNQSEPIQSSVGLRLAFLSESEPQKRKNVKDLVKEAYKFRSSYIHHGKIKKNWELLTNLQHTIWTGVRNAMFNKNKFKTSEEFFNSIEKMILT